MLAGKHLIYIWESHRRIEMYLWRHLYMHLDITFNASVIRLSQSKSFGSSSPGQWLDMKGWFGHQEAFSCGMQASRISSQSSMYSRSASHSA